MKGKWIVLVTVIGVITLGAAGCGNKEAESTSEEKAAVVEEVEITSSSEYYLNEDGILVDKVEEFKTQSFGEYSLTYPILEEGVDEVAVYEFNTNENVHVVLDGTNIYQQISLDTMGDYGAVELEVVAQGDGMVYMFDGERYYIEDEVNNLLTISDVMK